MAGSQQENGPGDCKKKKKWIESFPWVSGGFPERKMEGTRRTMGKVPIWKKGKDENTTPAAPARDFFFLHRPGGQDSLLPAARPPVLGESGMGNQEKPGSSPFIWLRPQGKKSPVVKKESF